MMGRRFCILLFVPMFALFGVGCPEPVVQELDADTGPMNSEDAGDADPPSMVPDAEVDAMLPPGAFEGPVNPFLGETPPASLSAFNLFTWSAEEGFQYNERVFPYALSTPLFSDYALKQRAIYVPEGQTMTFNATDVFQFPVGSVIVKTFYFPADFRQPTEDLTLIETRVLIHQESGWESWPYVWNEAQTDASLAVIGDLRTITFIDPHGDERTANYAVPQRNECGSCHGRLDDEGGSFTSPIGPAARHLARDFAFAEGEQNQLAYMVEGGYLDRMSATTPVDPSFDFTRVEQDLSALTPEELNHAARSYMDTNCAHCHSPWGVQGVSSQLFLNYDSDDLFRLGICKRPGSAGAGTGGRTYDIVPGSPDDSILVFRVETTEVGAMMPLLGRSLQHRRGAELLRAWVAGMEPLDCDAVMMDGE